mmetsp:Transcript_23696/g.43381  ORF Transcript_23696/g.43381 Transcript_23696/m.43381 type:complete len:578 (-) Transcript_23696:109-1842(-)
MSCFTCGAGAAEFTCSRCQGARFCNTDCQRNGWRRHKTSCKALPAGMSMAMASALASKMSEVNAGKNKVESWIAKIWPNVGALQGEEEVDLGTHFVFARSAIAQMALGGAEPSNVRMFAVGDLTISGAASAGPELQSFADLRREALRGGIIATDGSEPRQRRSTNIRPSISSTPPRYDSALVGGQVLRLSCDDPELSRLVNCSVPVVIEASRLCGKAVDDWSFAYLDCHLNDVDRMNVLHAPAKSKERFAYYDRNEGKNPCGHPVKETNKSVDMRFMDFRRKVTEAVQRRREGKSSDSYYLQNTILHREEWTSGEPKPVGAFGTTCGVQIMKDIKQFRWDWLRQLMKGRHPQMCQFFCGAEGGFSPCHYDPQDNFFAQIRGLKRVLLFHPKHFGCLYPWPVHHPQDRQSRVNFDKPDLKTFPRYAELKGQGLEAIVGPGDVIRIPPGWWHHIEMLSSPPDGEVVSVNFWYEAPPWFRGDPQKADIDFDRPLSGYGKVSFRRSLEELAAKLVDPGQVKEVISMLAAGPQTWPAADDPRHEILKNIAQFVQMVMPEEQERNAFLEETIAGRWSGLAIGA